MNLAYYVVSRKNAIKRARDYMLVGPDQLFSKSVTALKMIAISDGRITLVRLICVNVKISFYLGNLKCEFESRDFPFH